MSRGLSILLILCSFFAFVGCNKSTDTATAAAKAQAIVDDKIISTYLTQNPGLGALPVDSAGFNTGVYYIIKQQGTGSDLYTNSTQVTVSDTGRLLYDGKTYADKVFSQTNDFHPTYILSQVLRGWQLGLPQCKKGGIIRLLVPSRYAYGPNEQPTIGLPANAILDFDIQVYDIIN
jgi:FKBP-type peptidyl-prolyl cis-trans isomerase FkpA